MRFWLLENPAGNYIQVHRAQCERCLDGTKQQPGTWTGYDDYQATMEYATRSKRPVLQCTTCHPERFA